MKAGEIQTAVIIPASLKRRADKIAKSVGLKLGALWRNALIKEIDSIEKNGLVISPSYIESNNA